MIRMEAKRTKILVVDDTEATRYAIARTLQKNGFDTVEAENGTKALAMVLSEKPDLVTLDIHLPDINGFEVCRLIKTNVLTSHIPVLQVSASYVTSKDRIHGLEGGADSYLTHPFEPPVLLATIKALLRSRQLFEHLRLSEELFRVALKNAPITIYTCDLNLNYTWIYNPPAPLHMEEFIGKVDHPDLDDEDAKKLRTLKLRSLEQKTGTRELISIKIKGQERHFDMTVEPFFEQGAIQGLTVAAVDVTERVRSEKAQKQLTEDAELANQAKSRFLSNMSHEIRTPLGVIQGFAELALDPDIQQAELHEFLTTIKRNAFDLTKLLGEILDLSKIEAGRIEIEKDKFSLPQLVTDLVSALRLQAQEKGIYLKLELDGTLPENIYSDSTRIRQVLINLINNAIKFTSRGGVTIRAKVLNTWQNQESSTIEFYVQDTGIGLSEEQIPRLFEPFSQADSSTTRKYGGTGLGLSLSKKLATALGGELSLVESTLHRGSIFKFSFDAGALSPKDFTDRILNVPEEAMVLTAPFNLELFGLKILLVEDSIDNQRLFTRYLRQTGAIVDLASNGVEGVEKASLAVYDVILMDVQMPDLDGHDATIALRERGIEIPIIALTAHAMREERERALSHGFNDYLIKPLSPQILLETLSKYYRLKKSQDENLV